MIIIIIIIRDGLLHVILCNGMVYFLLVYDLTCGRPLKELTFLSFTPARDRGSLFILREKDRQKQR